MFLMLLDLLAWASSIIQVPAKVRGHNLKETLHKVIFRMYSVKVKDVPCKRLCLNS